SRALPGQRALKCGTCRVRRGFGLRIPARDKRDPEGSTRAENRGVPVLKSLGYAFLDARSGGHPPLFCLVALQTVSYRDPGRGSPALSAGCPAVRMKSRATFQSDSSSLVGAGISAWPTLNCLSRC